MYLYSLLKCRDKFQWKIYFCLLVISAAFSNIKNASAGATEFISKTIIYFIRN